MRVWWMTTALAASMLYGGTALAQDNCPPGSWFCEEVSVPDPVVEEEIEEEEEEVVEQAPPPKKTKKIKKKKRKKKKAPHQGADDVEVKADGDDTVVIVREGQGKVVVVEREKQAAVPPVPPKPAKKKKREKRFADTLGLGVHLEGAIFPAADDVYDDVGMGGLGASFRVRPSRYFAIDLGTDVVGGTDYLGQDRVELAARASGIVYFNPQHAVQVYGLGGVHASHAWVNGGDDYYYPTERGTTTLYTEQEHDYLGLHAGIGVEFRIGKHFALHTDLIGLVRTRVSDGPAEFTDPYSGETTDTSGAGLLRFGALFWW